MKPRHWYFLLCLLIGYGVTFWLALNLAEYDLKTGDFRRTGPYAFLLTILGSMTAFGFACVFHVIGRKTWGLITGKRLQ